MGRSPATHQALRLAPARRVARWVLVALACWLPVASALAFGETTAVDLRVLVVDGDHASQRPTALQRLAWELHKRTSVEVRVLPSRVRLDAAALYESPFLYWPVARPLSPLSERELQGLRRFVELGGFVVIDDLTAGSPEVDQSVRRELARALRGATLRPVPSEHVVYRSYYLVREPIGRSDRAVPLEAIERGGRLAVLYSRHDLAGAWERTDSGQFLFAALPGGERQRELAYRLGVNIAMYALCLDYKDDQVHAPFIMRRRSLRP